MTEELPIQDPPRWHVRTRYFTQTKTEKLRKDEPIPKDYQLVYGGTVQATRRGTDGERSLREMASFFNRKRLEPRDRIECAADAPNPQKHLEKISS